MLFPDGSVAHEDFRAPHTTYLLDLSINYIHVENTTRRTYQIIKRCVQPDEAGPTTILSHDGTTDGRQPQSHSLPHDSCEGEKSGTCS